MQQEGIEGDLHTITSEPPTRGPLAEALRQLGRARLLHTVPPSGQSYRALGAATVRALRDDQVLDALAADGRLIRRPFLIARRPF